MIVKNRLWLWVLIALLSTTAAFAQTPAAMNTPTPGSTLPGSSVTFVWDPGSGASEFWLWIGTAPATYNLYDANQNLNTSVTVDNLPTNGKPVYVRLFSLINGAWQYNDYTYTAQLIASPATMNSPTPGTVLPGTSVQFSWSTGTNVTEYWLYVGSAPGKFDYYDANQFLNTSTTVTGLPNNYKPLYVRLYSLIGGAWQYNDYTYTAAGAPATMNSPTPGSTFPGSSVTFNWSTGAGATEYWLQIGTTAGSHNLYDANQFLNTSTTVNNLPTNGLPLYVRLLTYINGAFQSNDYVYTSYSAPATMNSPTPGTTFPGSSVTFNWTTGAGVTEYWLQVGTTTGGHDVYDANQFLNTTTTVNNLPTNGLPLYVRLLSLINGTWQRNDYVYTSYSTPATMNSPTPGTTFPGSSVTFNWTTGAGVTEYWLQVGTTAGGHDLYDANQFLNTSTTVNNLPTNGLPLYVRLLSLINGTWQHSDYVYTSYSAPATMNSPTPGTTFPGSSVAFNWTTGAGVTEYWLQVGTTAGGHDLYDANQFLNTSATVNNLPTNGLPLYVRLSSLINGTWQRNDYVYTSYSTPATMNSPTPGTTFPGSSVAFNWSTGAGATEYWLQVGTTAGGHDLYDANQFLNTSATVNNLPTNGLPLYVRLSSLINGTWQRNDYVYTSYSTPATMNSPTPGTTFPGSSVTFNWTTGAGATEYWLQVGTTAGGHDLYDANQFLNTSTTVNNLPTNGSPIYVRLQSYINGAFQYNDYTYTAYLPPLTPAQMLTPTPGGFLPDTTTTFTWNAGYGATEYWLWVGSAPGTNNYYDANQHLNLSGTVSGLPQDGTPVYVRLFSYISGAFQYNDYTYRASLPSQPVVTISSTNHPQVAQYTIIVPKDGVVSVQYGLTGYNLTTNQVPAPAGGGITKLYVAGMLPNSLYHMQASIAYSDSSNWQDIDRIFTTGAGLTPSQMPGIAIQTPNPGLTPSPGIELVNGIRPTGSQVQVFAIDLQGNIVWYYIPPETGYSVSPVKLLPNGNMMLLMGGSLGTLREIDLAGNTVHNFTLGSLQNALTAAGYNWTVNSMHHEFLRLANGHTILLINRNKVVNGTTLLGDQIVDLDPNYNIVWLWDSFDHLDTSRFPYGFTPTSDWTHSNALFYSPVDGSLLLSSRHQSWVMKIDYANGFGTGNVLWRFGFQGDFNIASNASDWQFGQHNPTILSQNGSQITMSLFDDGNYRVDANGLNQCDGNVIKCQSRNVIYTLDESTKNAALSWSYVPTGVFSQATGSSQQLPNGDMEADFNFILQQNNTARVIETTRDAIPQVVWEFDLSGETAYRSTRLGSLYPGVQW